VSVSQPFECSSCHKDASQDPRAQLFIAVPEGKSREDAPSNFREALAQGFSVELLCGSCQDAVGGT
jgi:hypothetical protein